MTKKLGAFISWTLQARAVTASRCFERRPLTACALGLIVVLSANLSASTRQPGYPVPHVAGPTVPQSVSPGGPDFTLTVYGANFIPSSIVNWNRQPRVTTYVSAHELQAQILASDIAIPTAAMITVTTTSPKGPITSSTYFQVEVHDPMPTMEPTHQIVYSHFLSFLNGIADFNNDGFLDLAGTRGSSGFSTVVSDQMNNGKELFHPGSSLTVTQYPNATGGAFGDFNGDGNVDYLYVIGESPQSQPVHLAISFGNGDGTFIPGSSFGSFGGQGPVVPGFVVGDFNQDGVLDVAAYPGGAGFVEMFLGNGDGTFTQGKTTYVGNNGGFVAGDFNGDGKLDLLAIEEQAPNGNSQQWALNMFLGNGDGTFQSPQRMLVIPMPINDHGAPSCFISDFNKDGKLDIAFSNFIGQVGILLGNGDGTFRPPVFYNVASQFWFAFALGDFNSDGNTDIIVQQSVTSSEFSILLGNGDGTFRKKQKVNAGGYQGTAFTVADFNNDGLLDFSTSGFDYYVYLQQ